MPDSVFDPDILIQKYLEDSLSEQEAAALLELLQKDAAASGGCSQRLLEQLSMEAMLRDSREHLAGPVILPAVAARTLRGRFAWKGMGAAAAVAACITMAATWVFKPESVPPVFMNDVEEATTAAVAVLARGAALEWEGEEHAPGSPLAPGWLRLKSGLAQIEFYQGARVTLEGPAEFRLISANEAVCISGKLSAHVPPQAKGFKIETPQGTIVDLGTDFGLDLTRPDAELHVFKGEVELHGEGRPMTPLKEGQGTTLGAEKRAIQASLGSFASLTSVDERTAESQRLAFENWLARSPAWNEDPALLMRLDFQDAAGTRSLRNQAAAATQVPAGSIVGCDWTEGRWPGKRALEFRNVSDRVRLSLPGEYRSLTLSAWVRVNGLDRPFNSLFMAEGYEEGAIHWQITREGKLRLGLAARAGQPSRDHDTPALFTPERFGQWLHLATVIDADAGEVRHYLNGDLVSRVPRTQTFAVQAPVADLGNWNDKGRRDRTAIRHFSGAMDEFMLFSRVLTEAEIAKLGR